MKLPDVSLPSGLLVELMTAANLGLTLHDDAGRLVCVNASFFSEGFLHAITGGPATQTLDGRHGRGAYWLRFGDIFGDTPEFKRLLDDGGAGPLPSPITLRAITGDFFRIEEQAWDGGIVSLWTDVSAHVGRERALEAAHAELEALNARLAELAETDGLTGLPNRRRFQAALVEAEALARDGTHGAVGVIDLDFFQAVNDRFGHDAGDAVLVEAARRLTRTLKPGDLLARLGGEAFGIVFKATSFEQSSECAERMRKIVGASPFAAGASQVELTASIGLAALTGSETPDESLRRADMALFKAKDGGRDMVFWDRPFTQAAEGAGSQEGIGRARADAGVLEDEGLDAARLEAKYRALGDQHPRFDRDAWRRARAEGRTLDHYWNWVDYSIALALQ